MQLAADQQEARYEGDPWEEVIGPWLESKETTAISEVLERCINKPQAQWTQTDKIRAARCLRAQGWLRYRERQGSGSNGGIEREFEMEKFPVFLVLFPVCSQSGPTDSLRSQCSGFPVTTHMDVVAIIPICLPTRNTGNIRNRIEASRVGLVAHVEQNGNTGNWVAEGTG